MSQADVQLTASVDFAGAEKQVNDFVAQTAKKLSDIKAKASAAGGSAAGKSTVDASGIMRQMDQVQRAMANLNASMRRDVQGLVDFRIRMHRQEASEVFKNEAGLIRSRIGLNKQAAREIFQAEREKNHMLAQAYTENTRRDQQAASAHRRAWDQALAEDKRRAKEYTRAWDRAFAENERRAKQSAAATVAAGRAGVTNTRAVNSATNRATSLNYRIGRQLNDKPELQSGLYDQVDKSLKNYTDTVKQFGAGSLAAAKAHGQMQLSFQAVNSKIAEQGGLLKTLRKGFDDASVGGQKLSRFMLNTQVALSALMGAFGFREVTQAIVKMEQFRNMVKVVSDNSAELAVNMNYITNTANKLGYALTEIGQPFARFSVASKGAGFGIKETQDSFTKIAGMSRALGMTTAQAEGVIKAFEQILSKGRLSAEEIRNQLGDRIPGAMKALEIATGKSGEELDKMMREGKVSVDKFFTAYVEALYKMNGGSEAAERASKTLGAAIGRVGNAFALASESIGQKGFSDAVAKAADALANFMTSSKGDDIGSTLAKAVGVASDGFIGLLNNINIVTGALVAMAAPRIVALIGTVTEAVLTLTAAMLTNPFVAAAAALGALTVLYLDYRDNVKKAEEQQKNLLKAETDLNDLRGVTPEAIARMGQAERMLTLQKMDGVIKTRQLALAEAERAKTLAVIEQQESQRQIRSAAAANKAPGQTIEDGMTKAMADPAVKARIASQTATLESLTKAATDAKNALDAAMGVQAGLDVPIPPKTPESKPQKSTGGHVFENQSAKMLETIDQFIAKTKESETAFHSGAEAAENYFAALQGKEGSKFSSGQAEELGGLKAINNVIKQLDKAQGKMDSNLGNFSQTGTSSEVQAVMKAAKSVENYRLGLIALKQTTEEAAIPEAKRAELLNAVDQAQKNLAQNSTPLLIKGINAEADALRAKAGDQDFANKVALIELNGGSDAAMVIAKLTSEREASALAIKYEADMKAISNEMDKDYVKNSPDVLKSMQDLAAARTAAYGADKTKQDLEDSRRIIDAELSGPMGKAFKDFADGIEDGVKDAFAKGFDRGENLFDSLLDGMKKSFKRLLADIAFEAIAKPIMMPIVQQIGTSVFGLSEGAVNKVTGGTSGVNGIFSMFTGSGSNSSSSPNGGSSNGGGSASTGWFSSASDSIGNAYTGFKNWANTPIGGYNVGSANVNTYVDTIGSTQISNANTGVQASGAVSGSGSMGGLTWGGAGGAALGGAMAGYGAGQMVRRGNKAGGALAGAASGAMTGAAAGPWGALIGAIVGGIAGLIGAGNKPSNFGTGGTFDAVSGQVTSTWTDKYNSETQAARGKVEQGLGQIATALRNVGARWDAMKVSFGIGSRDDWKATVGNREITASKDNPDEFFTKIASVMGQQAKGLGEEVAFIFAHNTTNKLEELLANVDFADNFQRSLTRLKSTASLTAAAFDEGVEASKAFAQSIGDFLRKTANAFKAALPVNNPNTFFGKTTYTQEWLAWMFDVNSGNTYDGGGNGPGGSGHGDGTSSDGFGGPNGDAGIGGDSGTGTAARGTMNARAGMYWVGEEGPELIRRGFARGTLGAPSGWAWVGEEGPELIRMRGGEQVLPHEISTQYANSQAVTRGYADGTGLIELLTAQGDVRYLSGFDGDNRNNAQSKGRIEDGLRTAIHDGFLTALKVAEKTTPKYTRGLEGNVGTEIVATPTTDTTVKQLLGGVSILDTFDTNAYRTLTSTNAEGGSGYSESLYNPDALKSLTADSVANVRTVLYEMGEAYRELGQDIPQRVKQARDAVDSYMQANKIETNEARSAQFKKRLSEVGIGADQIKQVGTWMDAASAGTTIDFSKIQDAKVSIKMMDDFTTVMVEAGKVVPDVFVSIKKQLEALDAARGALDAQVAGTNADITEGEKAVETARGYWKGMADTMAEVGYTGDVAAQKLATGLANAIKKIQKDYADGMDSTLRQLRGEGSFDTGISLIETYMNTLRDINAIWDVSAERTKQTAKATEILSLQLEGLSTQGATSVKTFRDLLEQFKDSPEAVKGIQSAMTKFLSVTKENGLAVINKAIDPNYAPSAAVALKSVGLDAAKMPVFTDAFQKFMDEANAGTATASSLRETHAKLNTELDAGILTGDQYNTLLASMVDAYSKASEAVKAHIEVLKKVVAGEQNWRKSALLGDKSTLDSKAKLDLALTEYNTVLEKAQKGDPASLDSLDSVRDAVLELARGYYASSEGYTKIFDQLISDSYGLESIAAKQLSELQLQTGLLSTIASDAARARVLGPGETFDPFTTRIGNVTVAEERGWGLDRGFAGMFGASSGGQYQKWLTDTGLRSMYNNYVYGGMQLGGIVGAYANGGVVGNGLWNVDSVIAQYAGGGNIALAGGEHVTQATAVNPSTLPTLQYINQNGSVPANDDSNEEVVTELRALLRHQVAANNAMLAKMTEMEARLAGIESDGRLALAA